MDKVSYYKFINSIKPDPSHIEIIKGLCRDLGLKKTVPGPYWWRLSKEDKSVDLMTISLTMGVGGKWSQFNTIQKVREQILNYFK